MEENRITNNSLMTFLTDLGMTSEQASVYITLVKHGVQTKLELSRNSNIKRTTVYRLVESLKKDGVVEEIIDEHRMLIQAVSPDRLEKLLKDKQDKVDEITKKFPQIKEYLQQQIASRQPDTKVLFYRGISGIQQMAWNELRADKQVVGYTQSEFHLSVGEKFAFNLYEEFSRNNITMRDIFSDHYIESIGGSQNLGKLNEGRFSGTFESRYISPSVLDVSHTMDVYNDVLALYNWEGDEIFGIEIYNGKVARMQKQLFEILWKMAIPEKEYRRKALGNKIKIT